MKLVNGTVYEVNWWTKGAVQCKTAMLNACSMHVKLLNQQSNWPFVCISVPPLLPILSTYGRCRDKSKHLIMRTVYSKALLIKVDFQDGLDVDKFAWELDKVPSEGSQPLSQNGCSGIQIHFQ